MKSRYEIVEELATALTSVDGKGISVNTSLPAHQDSIRQREKVLDLLHQLADMIEWDAIERIKRRDE